MGNIFSKLFKKYTEKHISDLLQYLKEAGYYSNRPVADIQGVHLRLLVRLLWRTDCIWIMKFESTGFVEEHFN